jgi:hypothetical protein
MSIYDNPLNENMNVNIERKREKNINGRYIMHASKLTS